MPDRRDATDLDVNDIDWNAVVPPAVNLAVEHLERFAEREPGLAAAAGAVLRRLADALETDEAAPPEVAHEPEPEEPRRPAIDTAAVRRWAQQLRQKAAATRWQIQRLKLLADPAKRGGVQLRDAEIAGSCQGLWMCSPAYNQELVADPALAEELATAYETLAAALGAVDEAACHDADVAGPLLLAEGARRAVADAARRAGHDREDDEARAAGELVRDHTDGREPPSTDLAELRRRLDATLADAKSVVPA